MDRIYDELDKFKAEAEKLREECKAKTELLNSLRKVQIDQLAKIQEATLEIDKLAQELNAKSEEINEIRQMYEELQSSLRRKDLFLQQISGANEKLRADYGERFQKMDSENRDLVLALDEASARIQELEKRSSASSEEIAGLRRILSVKQQNSFDQNASMDREERDDYILKLEEQIRITQDQLKWKNEQFLHLEEAHEKLGGQFEASKLEWQNEKFSLMNEISSLQANLDSQVRISENLETQLRTSNQSLAHEESRRKILEIEVSDFRSKFENVFLEHQVAKSEIEKLTMKRDEEIAELRIILRKQELLAKETKYRNTQLEQENGELLVALKDIRDAQLSQNSTSSSLKKLRNKLQGLEHLHNKCAVYLKEKEAEWNSRNQQLVGNMKKLEMELEDCQWLLEVKNDEISSTLMILKSEFHAAYSKLHDAKDKLETRIVQNEEKNMLLKQQLESKNTELRMFNAELKNVFDEMPALMEIIQQEDYIILEELKRRQSMHDSNKYNCHLERRYLDVDNTQRDGDCSIRTLLNGIAQVKNELAEKEAEKIALFNANNTLQRENGRSSSSITENDHKIQQLQEELKSLDQKFRSAVTSFAEKEAMLDQAFKTAEDQRILDIEKKNQVIASLENEVNDLREKVDFQEKLLAQAKQEVQELAVSLQAKASDMQELKGQFEDLESQKTALVEEYSEASIDTGDFLAKLEGLCGQFGVFCRDDVDLMGMLWKILQVSAEDSEPEKILGTGELDSTAFCPHENQFKFALMKELHLQS